MRTALAAAATLFVATCAGCAGKPANPAGPALRRFTHEVSAVGTKFRITLFAADAGTADAALAAATARLDALDRALNPDRPDGEARRLADSAGGPPRKVGDDLFIVLQLGERISRASGGAFDVTAGPYHDLWRRAYESGAEPSEGQLEAARPLVGREKLRLDAIERTVSLPAPGTGVDPGAIGPAYAADRVVDELAGHGVQRVRVEVTAAGATGRTIVVSGPPPGRAGWPIPLPGVTAPGRRGGKPQPRTLHLANAAVSFSANTPAPRAARPSWLIDPLTGKRVAEGRRVIVVARHGASAAPLAAAAAVLGREAGEELVRSAGAAAHFAQPAR